MKYILGLVLAVGVLPTFAQESAIVKVEETKLRKPAALEEKVLGNIPYQQVIRTWDPEMKIACYVASGEGSNRIVMSCFQK
jgi:hypothetical protein